MSDATTSTPRLRSLPALPILNAPTASAFTFRRHDDGDGITVYESVNEAFGMAYTIDVFDDGTVSGCMASTRAASYDEPTFADLTALAGMAETLPGWLDDCATALEWTCENAAAIIDASTPRPPVVHIVNAKELEERGHTLALCGEPFHAGQSRNPDPTGDRTAVMCPVCEAITAAYGAHRDPNTGRYVRD